MATLESRLSDDMVSALKAHDKQLTQTLRMAIAAIRTEKVAGKTARELSEAEEIVVLQREVAKRKDSAEAYTQGNRPELAARELAARDGNACRGQQTLGIELAHQTGCELMSYFFNSCLRFCIGR